MMPGGKTWEVRPTEKGAALSFTIYAYKDGERFLYMTSGDDHWVGHDREDVQRHLGHLLDALETEVEERAESPAAEAQHA